MDLVKIHNYNLSKLFLQAMTHHASGGACATFLAGQWAGETNTMHGLDFSDSMGHSFLG